MGDHGHAVDAYGTYLAECPVHLEIVDLESHVWHDPVGLYRTQIHADDFGGRVQLSGIQRPDAGSGTAVENVLWLLGDRGDVERTLEQE